MTTSQKVACTIPFLKAICHSKKLWQACHTGIQILMKLLRDCQKDGEWAEGQSKAVPEDGYGDYHEGDHHSALGHWWISWDSPCRQYHLFLLGADYYALHWTAGFANQMPHTSSFTWIPYYQSLASGHVNTPAIYNPNTSKGSHWSNVLTSSGVVRLQCSSQMHPCWSQGQIPTLMSSLMCPIPWCILPKYFTQSHAGFCYHCQCPWHPCQAISYSDCPIPLIFTQHLLWVQIPSHPWCCAISFLLLFQPYTCIILVQL